MKISGGFIGPYKIDEVTLWNSEEEGWNPVYYHRLKFPTEVLLHNSISFWQLTIVLFGFGFWLMKER